MPPISKYIYCITIYYFMEYRFKGHLVEELYKDYRIKEGMKACMNCGMCTAVCPAAEFYKYNPKNIVNIVARKSETDSYPRTGQICTRCGETRSEPNLIW